MGARTLGPSQVSNEILNSLSFPRYGEVDKIVIFQGSLKDIANSADMVVDGSVTSVDFFVEADPVKDRYIQTLLFVIADGGANMNEFGGISALTNGCLLTYERSVSEFVTIRDELKSNFDFLRLGYGPGFGNGANALRLTNAIGSAEAYIPSLNFSEIFGLRFGLRLMAGTTQKLILRVRDNLAGLTAFNAIVCGFEREPD